MIISIDGPAGSGKSTIAKMLAKNLGFTYIDTGAMYRAIALNVKKHGVNPEDKKAVVQLMKNTFIKLKPGKNGIKVYLGDEDISEDIRTEEIGKIASIIARHSEVREILVKMQREMGIKAGNVVIEGRDTGTVIFPDADIKIFLTATPEVRARRRFEELKNKGLEVSYHQILKEVKERDFIDRTRKDSPLKPAHDAVVIDTSNLTIEDLLAKIIKLVKQKDSLP